MLVSDVLVLVPVGTGVMLNIDITVGPKNVTVWFQILFCFQWILVFCSKCERLGNEVGKPKSITHESMKKLCFTCKSLD